MSQAIVNLITKDTTKEQLRETYRNYPSTVPNGKFEQFHASTVEPIFCEIPKKSKVLDIGCNSGELMEMLRDGKGCEVSGVDISETALAIAKGKKLDVLYADAEELPFKDKEFDVVIMREVLSHLHKPENALKEARRVLKDGGFLIGSTPHANLERVIWEEQRLHHRYYDESSLKEALGKNFDQSFIRILKGGQFLPSFANSMMANEPAEMLFKCGGEGLKDWEQEFIEDTKTLRVWMGPTFNPAHAYYRLIGYAIKMRQLEGVEIGFDGFSWRSPDGCSAWQEKIFPNKDGQPNSLLALDQLEKCLKVADPWVFQLTYNDNILAFFEVAKQVHPKKKFVTECDDWVFDIPGYNVASHPYTPSSPVERTAYGQLKMSDALILSTEYLREKLKILFPEKPMHIIPNSIDFDLWDHCLSDEGLEKKKEGVIRIGFTGCGNHGGDLEIIKPVILTLLEEFENVEFIFAEKFKVLEDIDHPRFKMIQRWVNIIDYPSMLKGWDMDIGVAPLRDNEFNRAKSNLRWLEYSALKVPTIMSKVRPFQECVKDGVDGFLCTSKTEWYDAFKALIVNKNLREMVGKNAYNRVKNEWNMDKVAETYKNTLEEIKRAS